MFWVPGSSLLSTPCSLYKTLTLEESPCNCSQWSLKFHVHRGNSARPLPFSLRVSADSSAVPPVSSLHTAHSQSAFSPPWSISGDALQLVWVPVCVGPGVDLKGKTQELLPWAPLGLCPYRACKCSYSCSNCIFDFLADWLSCVWNMRSKGFRRWSLHIHSNIFNCRELS